MQLVSKAFNHMTKIPRRFTCQGLDISPQLEILDVPEHTKSFVLIVDDPDVPLTIRKDGMWVHWVLYNLSSDTLNFSEGTKIGTAGVNTSGKEEYMGPCPPDREHRYFFKLYALDIETNFKAGLSKEEILEKIKGHVIEYVELIGLYEQD